MDKPEWADELDWQDFIWAAEDLTAQFIMTLPSHEYERLRSDVQLFRLVKEQVCQKLVSTVETYRSKGMYGAYAEN